MLDAVLLYEAIACEREMERDRAALVLAARRAVRSVTVRNSGAPTGSARPLLIPRLTQYLRLGQRRPT